jgi:predicted nucleic acid-binding protein
MATITVRNLPDSVVQALKELAQRNNRSMEQEVREIISSRVMDRRTVVRMLQDGWRGHARPIRELLSMLFLSDVELVTPESLKSELVNVLWLAVRAGALELGEALAKLDAAELIITRSIPTAHIWNSALVLATQSDHSPYDTLFVAAAEREGIELLTYDRTLRAAFPATAVDPAEYLRHR